MEPVHRLFPNMSWFCVATGLVGYVLIAHVAPGLPLGGVVAELAPTVLMPLALSWLLLCAGAAAVGLFLRGARYRAFRQLASRAFTELSRAEINTLMRECFRRRGYRVTDAARTHTDGDLDLILHKGDAFFVVQCKHWRSDIVDMEAVQALVGSMYLMGAKGGFLVTSGAVTEAARGAARRSDVSIVGEDDIRRR